MNTLDHEVTTRVWICWMMRMFFLAAVFLLIVRLGVAEEKPSFRSPRVIAFASKYQKEKHLCPCRGRHRFLWGGEHVLPSGRWFVSRLGFVENQDPDVLDSAYRSIPRGWVAFDLAGENHRHLLPPPDRKLPVDVEMGRCGFVDDLFLWDTDSCAVGALFATKERLSKPTKQSILDRGGSSTHFALHPPEERHFYWEWNPDSDSVRPLGWDAHYLKDYVRAFRDTSYRIHSWDPPPSPSDYAKNPNAMWSGRIFLRHRTNGSHLVFQALTTRSHFDQIKKRFSESQQTKEHGNLASSGERISDQDIVVSVPHESFGPTEVKDSIVQIHGGCAEYRGVSIRRIHIQPGFPVAWRIDQQKIEHQIGERILGVHLIRGAVTPCRHLPLVIPTESRKNRKRPIWLLDTRTGDLDGPLATAGNFAKDEEFFDRDDGLATDRTGRLLVYELGIPNTELFVHSLHPKQRVARYWDAAGRYLQISGFDSKANIILFDGDRSNIFLWASPFRAKDMWQVW